VSGPGDLARPSFGEIFMGFALSLSLRSTCRRAKVGACVVTQDNHRVLAMGYNGGPRGLDNTCLTDEPGKCGCVHSEANCVVKLDFGDMSLKRMFTTTEPCRDCACLIVNSSISDVVYLRPYRLHDGLELLERAGIKVWKFDESLLIPAGAAGAGGVTQS
jgi:dCMP deaminase